MCERCEGKTVFHKKVKLSLKERLHFIKSAIEDIANPYIYCFDVDTKKFFVERVPLLERLGCALSCLETAITGRLYLLKIGGDEDGDE